MNTRYALVGIVLAVALAGGVFFMRKGHPVLTAPVSPEFELSRTKGPQDAPVEIIEYSDFQCPACQRAAVTVKKLLEAYPQKINFTFRHFPLPGHRWSAVAHQAAECAAQKGKFWQFHDRLYDNQPLWSVAPNAVEFFFQYAAEIGLSLEPFANCLTDQAVSQEIAKDKKSGEALKLNSTPTFFINKERLVGPVELEQKGEETIRRILGEPPSAPSQSSPLQTTPPQ